MALKNITITFNPNANLELPRQVRFRIKKDDGTALPGGGIVYKQIVGPGAQSVDLGVHDIPAGWVLSYDSAIQSSQGVWNTALQTPGVPLDPESVLYFDGYQIGLQ